MKQFRLLIGSARVRSVDEAVRKAEEPAARQQGRLRRGPAGRGQHHQRCPQVRQSTIFNTQFKPTIFLMT